MGDFVKLVAKMVCPICGRAAGFYIEETATLLREAKCECCGVSLRTADVAVQLIGKMGQGKRYTTLKACGEAFPHTRILNMFSMGKIHESLQALPGYSCGEFFDGVKSGAFKNGVQCVDLQAMPFKKNVFDFIITEDVLEHVENPLAAFREIRRVLRFGGSHIFTVPEHEKDISKNRSGCVPIYHGDPLREKGAMVITDFGNDLGDILRKDGMMVHRIVAHRFFFPKDISYLDDPEDYAVYEKNQQDLLRAFRYNSVVFIAQKIHTGFWKRLFG